ncbi:MAG: ankyrin repeat domain-containing protein, partial [Parachlamydia sp.]|nr:ankyrin repeat domain-containing protein [Parachlamydia sp.]
MIAATGKEHHFLPAKTSANLSTNSTLPVQVSPPLGVKPISGNVTLGPISGDRMGDVAATALSTSFIGDRARETLQALLNNSKVQSTDNLFIAQVQQTFVEFIEMQLAKLGEGKATTEDENNVGRAQDLYQLTQSIFQETARKQAELDKLEQLDAVDITKQKVELWAWAQQKHIEILKADDTLAGLAQNRKMAKETHDLWLKMEALQLEAKKAHADWEYLLKMQQVQAAGKGPCGETKLPAAPQTDTLLHQAAKGGIKWMVQKLLEAKYPKDKRDVDGNTPLACAVAGGKLEIAELFEITKRDAEFTNNKKCSILHLAVLSGNLEMVIRIHALNKLKINARDDKNQTPLFYAVATNHPKIAEYLKDQGAEFDVKDHEGNTLIDCAFEHEDMDMVEWLIDNAPLLLKKEGKKRNQPITHALLKGNVALAEKMLSKGAEFNPKNPSNLNLLHTLAKEGFCDCITWLAAKGLPVDKANSKGYTPILCAVFGRQKNAIRRLQELGAKTRSSNLGIIKLTTGQSIAIPNLVHAALYDDHAIEILDELIKTPADLLTPDGSGLIPLQVAVARGMRTEADYILQHDFHGDPESKRLETLLLLAVQSRSFEMVQWVYTLVPRDDATIFTALLDVMSYENLEIAKWLQNESGLQPNSSFLCCWAERGKKEEVLEWMLEFQNVDINYSASESGHTPFLIACYHHNWEGAHLLVKHGSLTNAIDSTGNTAWHYLMASSAPSLAWIKGLMSWSGTPSVNTPSKEGVTPIHIAVSLGFTRVVQTLEKEAKADTQAVDNENRTLLHFSAESGIREAVLYAFSKCKNKLHAKTKGGLTPLEIAIQYGNFACADYLLDQGAELLHDKIIFPKYLFYLVSTNNSRFFDKILKLERKNLWTTDYRDEKGRTLSLVALLNGHYRLASTLITSWKLSDTKGFLDAIYEIINHAKDPVEALKFAYEYVREPIALESDSPKKNALNEAVLKKQKKTADFLLIKDAFVDLKGGLFDTAVQSGSLEMVQWAYLKSDKKALSGVSCIKYNQFEIARWCRENQIIFPPASLHLWAQYNGSEEFFLFLMNQKFNIEERDVGDKTPLYVAIWHQNRAAAELLLSQKASLNFTDTEARELLVAVLFNPLFSTEFFDWLLSLRDWPLHSVDKKGFTLLEGAVFMGAARAAYALIKKGVKEGLTLFRKENLIEFQREAKGKYPSNATHEYQDLDKLLNCASAVNLLIANDGFFSFNMNNPVHRILLPIAIIHDHYPLVKFLLMANIPLNTAFNFNSPKGDETAGVYAIIYGRKDSYIKLLKPRLSLEMKVCLP